MREWNSTVIDQGEKLYRVFSEIKCKVASGMKYAPVVGRSAAEPLRQEARKGWKQAAAV